MKRLLTHISVDHAYFEITIILAKGFKHRAVFGKVQGGVSELG